MGCDIHFFVEKKVNEKWVSADKWTKDKYAEKDEDPLMVERADEFYGDRNYSLFAILADVRNGFGFAGCDLGEGFKPIASPRGLPINVSARINKTSDDYGADGHSHSWFTVQELLDYDWTQVTLRRGWMQALAYIEWNRWDREHGESPKEWCGGASGGSTEHISEEEMKKRIQELRDKYRFENDWRLVDKLKETDELCHLYCQVEWKQPYYKCCRKFLSDTLPRLWRLGKPEDVRIVFWFDN